MRLSRCGSTGFFNLYRPPAEEVEEHLEDDEAEEIHRGVALQVCI
jgi:hypothetical protein